MIAGAWKEGTSKLYMRLFYVAFIKINYKTNHEN